MPCNLLPLFVYISFEFQLFPVDVYFIWISWISNGCTKSRITMEFATSRCSLWISVVVIFCSTPGVWGHGYLVEPPQRSSLWRHGFGGPENYDDNGLNCGGFEVRADDLFDEYMVWKTQEAAHLRIRLFKNGNLLKGSLQIMIVKNCQYLIMWVRSFEDTVIIDRKRVLFLFVFYWALHSEIL
jgi:hypothetical protein